MNHSVLFFTFYLISHFLRLKKKSEQQFTEKHSLPNRIAKISCRDISTLSNYECKLSGKFPFKRNKETVVINNVNCLRLQDPFQFRFIS